MFFTLKSKSPACAGSVPFSIYFPAKGRRAQLSFALVCLSEQFVQESIMFGQWTISAASCTSDCICLPADFITNLGLPGIIVPNDFIHRFHVRIFSTAAVFTKFHSQYFCFLKDLQTVTDPILHCFYLIAHVFCKRKKMLEVAVSRSM